MADVWYEKLKAEVLDPGLETGDGTCVGLSEGLLCYVDHKGGLVVVRTEKEGELPRAAYEACPGRWCHYPTLNRHVFGVLPDNWLCGIVKRSFIGHATDETVRRTGASGGVITAVLLHLLETGKISGAVCLRVGKDKPWRAAPVVARTREELLACAGSVYSETPTNTILATLAEEKGPLAYVGLPDQVAAIRKLQIMKHPCVQNIAYVVGPYTGTQMSFEAIRSFLRSHGIASEEEILSLKYRAGEWPGHLEIVLRDGRTLRAEKFHYNYLIPFFITRGSLQLVDFTNELTDISVGDAWSPHYEAMRGGYSVVLARSAKAVELLTEMRARSALTLEDISLDRALEMHGHMLDFKKRGSFIRIGWRDVRPEYGYEPTHIAFGRIIVEHCLAVFFAIGRSRVARFTVEHLPLSMVGPAFHWLRKTWKRASKREKRRGLWNMKFRVEDAVQ